MHNCVFNKRFLILSLFALAILLMCQNARADDVCRMVVESATRSPKRICFAAENMTVVTAWDIEMMNARTVAEVLENVTGVFSDWNREFTSSCLISIQGSDQHHVAVFVDGIRWNFLSSGAPETSSIPVEIIERIEIVKGPASSVWGSALGGIIYIITKGAKYAEEYKGAVRFSYGEGKSQDYRAQLEGRIGNVRHYFYAGRRDSDGLRDSRRYENNSFYSKFHITATDNTNIGLTAGYSEPRMKLGDFSKVDITQEAILRTFFTTASFSTSLGRDFQMSFSFHHFRQKAVMMYDVLGLGVRGLPGEFYSDGAYDDETTGGSGILFWKKSMHNVVFGAEFDRGKLSQTFEAGPFLQAEGLSASSSDHDLETWAVYVNDTVTFSRLSVTAGIRYDHNNISGSFTSPSLGLTYLMGTSVLRASVARGFTTPSLLSNSVRRAFITPNPSLDYEDVWSYQAGIESKPYKNLWLKATLFHHELDNALKKELYTENSTTFSMYVNKGKLRTRGFEVEMETYPFHNFSLGTGFAYAHKASSDDPDNPTERYACNISLSYDDEKSLRASILGHYVNWDMHDFYEAVYDDFTWDLNINKRIYNRGKRNLDIFLKAHNIFSGSQYTQTDSKNPQRWIEIGVRFKF